MQPGPGHRAGIDATQLLPDGREEGAGPLQVVQEQDHTVVTHCRQGAGGCKVRGREGGASRESLGRQHDRDAHRGSQRRNRGAGLRVMR